jgi:ribonuclease D
MFKPAGGKADMAEHGDKDNGPGGGSGSRRDRRRGYSRADHRARAHADAHSDDAAPPPPHEALDHPLVPQGPAPLLATNAELQELIEHLRAAGSFAYDSEFIGELTYHPKLCVIQVASAERVALIDPMAPGIELRPFWELLCEPQVEKVVHAGDQDIEPVVRHLNRAPANFFDTQIAAGFCGLPYPVSLSKLVGELTGAKLGKGLTFTHWDQRPLSAMQLRYAADDVRYLPATRAHLARMLESSGHASWAAQECETLCEPAKYRFDPDTQYLRVRGAGSLQPRNLAVLRELTAWRDGAARQHDLPPRAFLKDEILIDLARNPAKSLDRLERVRGLPRPIEHAHGAEIVDATQRGWSTTTAELPPQRSSEQSPGERFRSDALWAAAQALCAGNRVDPAIVTSRQDMADFYHAISAKKELEKHPLMQGWRREALGEPLLELVGGSAVFAMKWEDGTLKWDAR